MAGFPKQLKKYMQLYILFFKSNLMSQMEYRANFIGACFIEIGWLAMKLLYAIVVYNTGVTINGLTPDAILIFIGTYTMMTGIHSALFYTNFANFHTLIRDGTLDILITKPVSLQFMATLKHVDIGFSVPNILGGLVMVIIGWGRVGIPVTFINAIVFMGFMLSGIILSYTLFLVPVVLSFWTVKGEGINHIMSTLWDFNNMPMLIYGKWIQRIGVFAFPLFLISNLSPLYVLGKLDNVYIAWGIAAPVVTLYITRLIWNIGVRTYNSASS